MVSHVDVASLRSNEDALSGVGGVSSRAAGPQMLIPRRNNPGVFEHQDHSPLWRESAVHHAFGHDESLARVKLHSAAFEIDQQPALDDVEKLIVVIVFVPVILALDD